MKASKRHVCQKPRAKWPRPASPRTLARFTKLAAEFGGTVVRAKWEPLFNHGRIFDGPEGGWEVTVALPSKRTFSAGRKWHYTAIGMNVDQALCDLRGGCEDFKRSEARQAS